MEQAYTLDPYGQDLHIQTMNKSSISNRPRNLPAMTLFLVLTVILLIVAAYLWHSHTASKDQLQLLSVQNSRLQEELATARKEIDNLNSGDSSAATRERLAAARATAKPSTPKVEIETLFLQTPTVEQTAEGLAVRLAFKPGDDVELPDKTSLVVRVPGGGARILSFKPVSEPDYSSIMFVVNAKGDLGMIEGSPSELGALEYELVVSGPVKATVRGSEGIIDFELDITPDSCTVRKL